MHVDDARRAMIHPNSFAHRQAPRARRKSAHLWVWLCAGLTTFLTTQGCSNPPQCREHDSQSCSSKPATPQGCLEADGCNLGPSCVLVHCANIETKAECTSHSACEWGTNARCIPALDSDPCATLTEQACAIQDSCTWKVSCSGHLKNCFDLSETECAAIPYCYMESVPAF